MFLELALIPQQTLDPSADHTAILLQLRFPRPTRADASSLTRKDPSLPKEPGKPVTQLSQFDLQTTRCAGSSLGEDVEDELSPIRNGAVEQSFDVSGLDRGEFTVCDHQ